MDIPFNIKTENSVDLHFLLYHKWTIRYAEISMSLVKKL